MKQITNVMFDMFDEIILMIEEFSARYLDEEYMNLSVKLAHRLVETDGFSFGRDGPEVWACAIIFAVGQLNFLFEGRWDPYVDRDRLCGYFSATRIKINSRAKEIRRLLKLKLGDEEFSTEFVSSLGIPESDDDLKRIRGFDEIRFKIADRPENKESLDNSELLDLIGKIRRGEEEKMDELYLLLRKTYFIRPHKGIMNIALETADGRFKIPIYTDVEECRNLMNDFDGLELKLWPFLNALYYIDNENFDGVIINPDVEGFVLTGEMIRKVYPDPESFDYWYIFFMRQRIP